MRKRPVRAGGDDRRERRILGAELAHPLLGGERDVALGPAGEPTLLDPCVDLVGQRRGGGDRLDLGLVLDPAEVGEEVLVRDELDALADRLEQLAVGLEARLRRLDPDLAR